MDVISAYQQVGTYRGAAAMCGVNHKTVKHGPSQHVLRPGYAPNLADTGGRSTGCAGVDTRRSGSVAGMTRLSRPRGGRT